MNRPLAQRTTSRAILTLGAAGALLLTGCAGSGTAPEPAPAAPPAAAQPADPAAGEGATQYPLTLTSSYGQTVLEQRPQRVAVVTFGTDLDAVLALGVTPVVAPDYLAEYEWAKQSTGGQIETLIEWSDGFPYEQILAAKPDLIVAVAESPSRLEPAYQRLSQIAPVVTAPVSSEDVPWQDVMRTVAVPLDLTRKAEEVITRVDTKVAEARAQHPEFAGKSAIFALMQEDGLYYRSYQGSHAAALLADLGFAPSPNAGRFNRETELLSEEQYELLDADILVVGVDADSKVTLEGNPLFQQLPVVRAGGYHAIVQDEDQTMAWALSWPTALNLPWLVDNLTPQLTQAVQARNAG